MVCTVQRKSTFPVAFVLLMCRGDANDEAEPGGVGHEFTTHTRTSSKGLEVRPGSLFPSTSGFR